MRYFVTGTTGFIGKRLVKKLLERKGAVVYFLVRPGSAGKVKALREFWGASAARVIPVTGDLTSKKLGIAAGTSSNSKARWTIFSTWLPFMT